MKFSNRKRSLDPTRSLRKVSDWLGMPPTFGLAITGTVPSTSSTESGSREFFGDNAVSPGSTSGSSSNFVQHKGSLEFINFTTDSLRYIGKNTEEWKEDKFTKIGEHYQMAFKMVRSDTKLIKTFLHSYGFTQCSSKNPSYNFLWAGGHMNAYKMRTLQPWQRLNQFPRSDELTRKDKLYENIARSMTLFGSAFDFIPEFFVTPRDSARMSQSLETISNSDDSSDSSLGRFIVKPVSASQGRGIFFADSVEEIPSDTPLLVSRYIDRPLTVNGHKFDLRIYVAVTSFYPLVTYIYSEGLTRLASGKYTQDARDEFTHLTNYSINKNSKDFIRNESMSTEDFGHKWTLGALLRHVENLGHDSKLLMLRIEDIVIKSLLSVQNLIASSSRTTLKHIGTNFELFGFDVLIDEKLKPWLLEVNLSPSLSCDAPLDSLVKSRLICDLLNLACVPLFNRRNAEIIKSENESPNDDIEDKAPVAKSFPRLKKSLAVKRTISGARRSGSREPFVPRSITTESRTRQFMNKLRLESERKGDFVRIFPRQGSYVLYRTCMENSGFEKYDRRVYEEEFGKVNEWINDDMEMIEHYHEFMIMAEKYPKFNSCSLELQSYLASWYETSNLYTDKITKEGEVYAARLPMVRVAARLRTQSCSDWFEVRKAKRLEAKKAQEEARLKSELDEKEQERKEDATLRSIDNTLASL